MVMKEGFRTIKGLAENKDPGKQVAIRKAIRILVEADVKDSDSLSIVSKDLVMPGMIRLPEVATIGMSNEEMEKLADSTRGLNVGDWGRNIIKRAPTASKEPLIVSPVVLGNARTMGIRDEYSTTKKVWDEAKKLGDRVTAEEMLQIAIEAAKGNIQVEIGKPLVGIMEPVADLPGVLLTLYVARNWVGLWLDAHSAYPAYRWGPDAQFVVSSRK